MRSQFVVSLVAVGVLVSGCDTLKEQVGLTRHTPDEFAVMQRAPLEVPSDLNSLPAPRPGAPRPQEVAAKDAAQQVILGAPQQGASQQSTSESVLLQKAGAKDAAPQIREQLELDAKVQKEENRSVIKRILGTEDDEGPAHVVDAEAELKRIQDAKKAGQPVTAGETPTKDE